MTQDRFKGSHFPKCIVLQAIYWYLRYALSYRDIEELMIERGVNIDHSTVQRWVVKYTAMLDEAFRKKKRKKPLELSRSFKRTKIISSWLKIISTESV
jgi:putative transposase